MTTARPTGRADEDDTARRKREPGSAIRTCNLPPDRGAAAATPRRAIRSRHRSVGPRSLVSRRRDPLGSVTGSAPVRPVAIALSDPETLGIVAHELRTPITTIFAGSKLLQEDRLSRRTRVEVVEALATEAERLRDFVEDLITLAGGEVGETFEVEPALVQRILPDVLEAEAARAPGTRFRAFVPRDLPPVAADDAAVRRLIGAVVASATDLGHGGGTVEAVARVTEGKVRLLVLTRHTYVADDRLSVLFDPVASVDRADRRPGMQFGLAAAHATAAHMGGAAWARRARGGVELGVELPIGLDERDAGEG